MGPLEYFCLKCDGLDLVVDGDLNFHPFLLVQPLKRSCSKGERPSHAHEHLERRFIAMVTVCCWFDGVVVFKDGLVIDWQL